MKHLRRKSVVVLWVVILFASTYPTVVDLMTQPALLGQIRQEWQQKTEGKPYKTPLRPDAVPPVAPEPKK